MTADGEGRVAADDQALGADAGESGQQPGDGGQGHDDRFVQARSTMCRPRFLSMR